MRAEPDSGRMRLLSVSNVSLDHLGANGGDAR